MKTDRQSLVQQFHERFGAPAAERPTLISRDRVALRVRLIAEELEEYARAAGLNLRVQTLEAPETSLEPDLVEVADALGDLEYVVLGSAVEHGIRLDPVVREIHRSNMTKSPATDAGGKILKGSAYEPPHLAGIVADQQAGKLEADPRRSSAIEQGLAAGFRGGWAAGLRTIADELEQQERKARIAAGGRPVSLAARPLAKMLLQRAMQPPTPQLVAMKPGESVEEATARPGAATTPAPVPPAEGAFPDAQEALPVLAGIVSVVSGGRGGVRETRAEWIALCAFALHARRCAQMDGVLEELEREAGALDLLVLTPENGAAA